MLQLKKEADVLEVGDLKIATCPVCKSYVCHQYYMKDAMTKVCSRWYACSCGVVFQTQKPWGSYDKKYWDKFNDYDKKLKDSFEYPVRIYAPLAEELIYGRKVLIIGRQTPHQEQEFSRRGWIPSVIDKNTHFQSSDILIVDDFEKHKFKESEKFNMIWIYHTLECFDDPVASLLLCHKLLAEDGILFIASPDTDFISTRSSSNFIHWKADYNHIMWNRRSIQRHLENLGFTVILNRQNYEHRFPAWDDFHVLAQKKFF
jgi:predicted SAM-dependent methyltransferase